MPPPFLIFKNNETYRNQRSKLQAKKDHPLSIRVRARVRKDNDHRINRGHVHVLVGNN